MVVRCNATREDKCEPCGMRHRRRLKLLIGSGFADRPTGFFFVTGTAPGARVLPWDTSRCNHGDRPCSGKDFGCQVERLAAARWNGFAPQVWSWMVTEIRRLLPGVDVQFWKCWETQKRGVLHVHAIIWALGVSEARMAKIWRKVLKTAYKMDGGYLFQWGKEQSCDAIGSKSSVEELIELHGFTPEEAEESVRAADESERLRFIRYGAKYCTKGGLRASTVNRVTGEIRDDGRGYRTWSASGGWGLRMKQIRAAQKDWAQKAATAASGGGGTAVTATGAAAGGALDTNPDFYAGVGVTESILPVSSSAALL